MTRNKFRKLHRLLAQLRQSPQKADALQKLARQLGRRPVKRGKEPTWESDKSSELRALTIPAHGGKDLSIGTKNSILNQLEDDLNFWDGLLSKQEAEAESKNKGK